jgi:hypothetical protein
MTEHWRALLARNDDCCELLGRLKEEYDLQHVEIERLRARVLELEAAAAMQRGTVTVQKQDDGGIRFTWNVPPSTPGSYPL